MRRLAFAFLTLALIPSAAMTQAYRSTAAKISNAMSAAPASIAEHATIMDWPAKEGMMPIRLREGTNGWVCYPDMPQTEGDDPMCLDAVWQQWITAYMKKSAPQIDRVGFGYMIAPGGGHTSNTDPFATAPTPDNEWGHDPPHVMVLVPDLKSLEGLPTKRTAGGPWVMHPGTPYAHVMVPLEPVKK